MGSFAFGEVIICPGCKTRKSGRTVYGKGTKLVSRGRAIANGWKIVGWRGNYDTDTVKVRCNECDGKGVIQWQPSNR